MSFDGLLAAVIGALLFSHLIAFALGRLTGMEAAFDQVRRACASGSKIPLHPQPITPEAQRNHG